VIEAELFGQLVEGERLRVGRVVAARRLAVRPADVDGAHGVLARIAGGIRVGEELLGQVDVQPGLFFDFPDAGGVERLAFIHEPAGQRPADRHVLAHDQDDAVARQLDDAVDGGNRVLVRGHGAPS